MRKYDCFYVLKYCKLEKELIINENIKIVPFDEGLEFSSEFDLIKNLSRKLGRQIQYDAEAQKKLTEIQRGKVGLAILEIKNIPANDEVELFKITDPYVDNLVFLLSLLKNSYIEIFLQLPIGVWEAETLFDIEPMKTETFVRMKYRGVDYKKKVEIVGHDLVELVLQKLPFHQIIEENPVLNVCKGLYYEYLGDQNRQMRFLRLWLILELQAESKISLSSRKLFDRGDKREIKNVLTKILEDKEISMTVKDKKIQSFLSTLNQMPILEKIRELLYLNEIKVKKVDAEKNLIEIMYQLRNCIVHQGGCRKYGNMANPCRNNLCKKSLPPLPILIRDLRNYAIKIIGGDMKIDFRGV